MRAAAGAHHVRADASREAQHQVGTGAARRGRGGPCESHQGQRASKPRAGAGATDIPVAGRAADLVCEDRDFMSAARRQFAVTIKSRSVPPPALSKRRVSSAIRIARRSADARPPAV